MFPQDTLTDQPRCFCKIPINDLEKWAYKKYVQGRNTLELYAEANNSYDRELISIIALLDVDNENLDRMLHHQTKPTCNLEECRKRVKGWLLNILANRESQQDE
jgi:hypothetical protein